MISVQFYSRCICLMKKGKHGHVKNVMALLSIPRDYFEALHPWSFDQIRTMLASDRPVHPCLVVTGYGELWQVPEFVQWARALAALELPLQRLFPAVDLLLIAQAVCAGRPWPT